MSRVAILKTVPFKREQENIIGYSSKVEQYDYFARLGGVSKFADLFKESREINFIPKTDTTSTLNVDIRGIFEYSNNTLVALNCQYVIVGIDYRDPEYPITVSTEYYFYFITNSRTINVNTVQYDLELDVFNTFVRGVDWDLPNNIPVDTTHLKRYTYDNGLVYNNSPYALNSDFGALPTYTKEIKQSIIEDFYENKPLWIYVILKTNESRIPEIIVYNNTEMEDGGDQSKTVTYTDNFTGIKYYSPYSVLFFLANGNNIFHIKGHDITASGKDIYMSIQESLSAYIVNIITSRFPPKYICNCSYEYTGVSVPEVTYDVAKGSWNSYGYGNALSSSTSMRYYGQITKSLFYKLLSKDTFNINNPSNLNKYTEAIFDPALYAYEYLTISYQNKEIKYNKLKLGFGQKTLYDYYALTDNGVVESLFINGVYYPKEGDAGMRCIFNNKIDMPSISDPYNNWLANNKNYGVTSYLLPTINAAGGLIASNAISQYLKIPQIGLIGGALNAVNAMSNIVKTSSEIDNIAGAPDKERGNSFELSSILSKYSSLNPYVKNDCLYPNYRDLVLTNVYMYGYKCGCLIYKSELFSRYKFNFLKTMDNIASMINTISASISINVLNEIDNRYKNGIREWKCSSITNPKNPFNYGNDNSVNPIDRLENWEQEVFDSLPE